MHVDHIEKQKLLGRLGGRDENECNGQRSNVDVTKMEEVLRGIRRSHVVGRKWIRNDEKTSGSILMI